MTLSPGRRLGPYEVTSRLGAGGMGEVWKAHDTRLGRDVAIKVLPPAVAGDPDRRARFEREARAISSLNHPHVCALYDVGQEDGLAYLVMEHVPGETLAERLSRGAIPLEEALEVARQVAEGLEAAHEKGIVHRDLKPANVKLLPDGSVRILDFGLAKAVEGERTDPSGASLVDSPTLSRHATEARIILGTAAYMSPEQARGRAVDKRADVWAFGVLLYEMLTGRRLFVGDTTSDVLAAVLRQEPDWSALPVGTPAGLLRLLRMCLERDPKHRLHDVADARVEIEQMRREPAPAAGATLPPRARARWRGGVRWTVRALVGAAAVLALTQLRTAPAAPPVVRAALALPADLRLELSGLSAGTVSVSLDGRRVVFGARRGGGRTMLYVRTLDDPEPRLLPGTEAARRPFWSPDGRSIGFFTETHLKRIGLDGGPALTLARSLDARGGTWSRDGTIVYAASADSGLQAIPASGGTPRPVTALGKGESTHRYPWFLPDGRRFLYLVRRSVLGPGERPQIVVGALDSTERTVLLEAASNPVFAAGHLLFARDGALFAQPLDPDRLVLEGSPRPIIDGIVTNRRFSFGAFSASEDVLAYQTGRQSDLSQYVWVDRGGVQHSTVGDPGLYTGSAGVALSPDGRLVAVSRVDPDAGDGDIWLYDLQTGNRRRLSAPGSDEGDPVFAPDGRSVFFDSRSSSMAGPREGRLMAQPIDGSAARELLEGKTAPLRSTAAPVSFSADGRLLVLEEDLLEGRGKLLALPVDGSGEPRPLLGSKAWERFGQVSPDGRWLAYASDEPGRFEVYVTTFPQAGTRWQVSREGGTEPRWRGDGRELFFFGADNVLNAVPVSVQGTVISFAEPQRLFQVAEHWGWRYAVARNGQSFLVRTPLEERAVSPITIFTGWSRTLGTR
jgi:Tol biopolymer transport system component